MLVNVKVDGENRIKVSYEFGCLKSIKIPGIVEKFCYLGIPEFQNFFKITLGENLGSLGKEWQSPRTCYSDSYLILA